MDDLLNEFLTETSEAIDVVDVELVTLERDPNNKSVLDNIFRLVHTIKGTCGFLGLPRLESVAHASENILGKFRDGELAVTPEAVSLILQSLDRIKEILAGLEATEAEPEGDDTKIITGLNAFASGGTVATTPVLEDPEPEKLEETADAHGAPGTRPGEVSLEELEAAFAAAPGPDDEETGDQDAADQDAAEQDVGGPDATGEAETTAGDPEPVEPPTPPESAGSTTKSGNETTISNQTIRVNVELLEGLMTMVSELVLTRNQLLQIMRRSTDTEFSVPLQRLSQCTSELQEGVMKTRMQPIGNAWAKLPRIVRDLSLELGKKIDLQMVGAETELDRQVLELIKDPLTHMVRNSADHGVEGPKVRRAAGKPETGTIRLNAFHEGGHIIIDIADDGYGLPVEKLKAKALKNKLCTEAELAGMTDQQIQKFIFHAGFSTAEKVTNISGRGVGMDVVRSNIEKIGGTIDLKSTEGKGTSFQIKIPLTLAIVAALIVKCGNECFAIPQISVLELVRASDDTEHRIEHINATPVLRLRDRLLPLVYLNDVLETGVGTGLDNDEQDAEKRKEGFIVVTQVGSFSFGIVVDQVFDTEEIVVKPVAPILRDIPVYSGNTILGDGSVIMILDPNGIATQTANVHGDTDQLLNETPGVLSDQVSTEAFLVFRAGTDTPKAVPLSLVARLEDIDVASIEMSEGRPVVQYRDRLMPLAWIEGKNVMKESGQQPVLVFTEGDHTMGLAVDEIIDIIEDDFDIELKSDSTSLMGTAVINGKATEIIDVSFYLGQVFGGWNVPAGETGFEVQDRHILMIDDSPFFQNMLKPLLRSAGYKVTAVAGADQALELRESGAKFDVIISDIEMPGMNGFDLAETIRQEGPWKDVPMVALSAHTNPQYFNRGREAGFSDYVKKFDRAALLAVLNEQLAIQGDAA